MTVSLTARLHAQRSWHEFSLWAFGKKSETAFCRSDCDSAAPPLPLAAVSTGAANEREKVRTMVAVSIGTEKRERERARL